MRNFFKAIALGLGICLSFSGCGTGVTVIAMVSPSISTVSPQVVTAGTPSVTVTVQGTNFSSSSALTVNGATVPTSYVSATTLAAKISGTPLASPNVAKLKVMNTNGAQSNEVSLTVTGVTTGPSALAIAAPTLPSGQVGVAYSGSFSATGGTSPYTWAVTGGSLPTGITLTSAGVLSGTPTVAGTSNFTVTVTDHTTPTQSVNLTLSLVVVPATVTPATLVANTVSLSAGQVGASYAAALSATGGTPGYTWSIASGSLPAGMALSSAGVISGTPTATGTVTFTARVSDSGSPAQTATVSESISVNASSLSITSGAPGAGKTGAGYSASLSATGGTPGYTWSIASGSLPAGLTLSSGGVISGTPSASGTASFTVKVTDSGSPVQTATQSESIAVSASASALTVTSASLVAGKTGTAYTASLGATGGTPSYTWTIASGSLPAGLTLSSGGVISGTPSASGTASFTVMVTDSGSPVQTATQSESIAVTASATALAVTSASLVAGKTGTTYTASLGATGGTPGYTWTIASGSLPAGLTLSSGGVISGTPTTAGTASFTVRVTDSGSPVQTATQSESIAVTTPPAPLVITSTTLTAGKTGAGYAMSLNATGGTPGYTWTIASGSLPAGLTLSSGGGISGTPTASGTSTFTVQVTDSGSPVQTATHSESIAVTAPSTLSIATTSLAAGTIGTVYTASLGATGGTLGYSWSIASGSLPAGLTLSSTGVISGTPTASGTSTFTVQVTDSGTPVQTATQSETIAVTGSATALAITSTSLADGQTGAIYTSLLTATGGTPAYTWTVSSGSLPDGLTISSAGAITGTPTTTGTFTFTVQVADSASPAATATWSASIVVSAPTPGTTWYVRPDGGTRYSSNATNGQCDGQGDQSYAAAVAANGGTAAPNLHCAFNDVRLLWQDGSWATDGSTAPAWGWVISGGDTVIIRGSISDGVSYRVGWTPALSGPISTATCTDATIPAGQANTRGLCGDPYGSGTPPPPSGTASQHTRILGENWAACQAPGAKTQLHGGVAVGHVFAMNGSSYVDVACLDITDFSSCGRASQKKACTNDIEVPVEDYATNGIEWSNTATNDTLTDVNIHGLAAEGMAGPTGDGVVMTRISIMGNAGSGWNADNGSGTTGIGHLLVQNFNISWNGCAEEYPMVDPVPYGDCTDDSSGGYGDGFGTATVPSPAPGWQVHFDQGTVSYNTQDGLDGLHISGPGSSVAETRVLAYGNEGQQLKTGGATAIIENSVIVGNCMALKSGVIPGTPAGYGSVLDDPCRAGNTAVAINVSPGYPAVFQNNTLYSNGAIGLEVEYASSDHGPTNTLSYNNNVFMGFINTSAEYATSIYSTSDLNMLTNPGSSWTNNANYHNKYGCPMGGETAAVCTDPGLTDETFHDYGYGNMSPVSSGNAVQGMGVAIPGITTDYTGAPRGNPPSIGAYENYVTNP